MTDTNPTCEVCDAELTEEIRARHKWIMKTSSIRGPSVERECAGWQITRRFECGSVSVMSADGKICDIEVQCPGAHGMVTKLRRRVVGLKLEAEKQIMDKLPSPSIEIINHIAEGGLASLSPDRSTWIKEEVTDAPKP